MSAKQYGFLVDSTRCVKCFACEIACQQWHGLQADTHMRRTVHERYEGTFPNVTRTFKSLSCMHCEHPACVQVCPVRALRKREEDGLVVVDKHVCIGCRSCALACPFDVPRYGAKKIMDKCDGCLSLGRALEEPPRCEITCPTRALRFGSLEEMGSLALRKGGARMEGETAPSVQVISVRKPIQGDEQGV